MRIAVPILALFILAACSEESPVSEPLVLNAHGMVYDAARDRIVVFGGATETAVSGLTYEWRENGWRVAASEGPEPRTFPAMAYAAALGGTVLFGGNRVLFGDGLSAENLLSDTWIWNGKNWRQVEGDGPGPRAEAAMAYDPVQKHLLLFGGYHITEGEIVSLGDSWAFDGMSWSKLSDTGPPPQNGAAMAYNAKNQSMILFGQNADRTMGETWESQAGEWRYLPQGRSERRYNSAMTYDAAREQILRFGGWTGEGRSGDTWVWSEDGWDRVTADGPSPRNHTQMIYDSRQKHSILFGGHDGENIFGDIWRWDGSSWHVLLKRVPAARLDNSH